MKLVTINENEFEYLNCIEEWTEFEFNEKNYRLKLSGLSEIRMSVYVYFDVKLLKENTILKSGEMQFSENYYVPVSPNKKNVYIPFRSSAEIINLKTEESMQSSVKWFSGNIYNKSSTKMIINGTEEFKVIDLSNMKELHYIKEGKSYNNDAFFGEDHVILQLKGKDRIEEWNLNSSEKKMLSIESPFKKYGIELEKFQPLINKKNHCLKLPDGGMGYSGQMDNWSYINTKDRTVFKTLIPCSEIKRSNGYITEYCDVEYRYVELRRE